MFTHKLAAERLIRPFDIEISFGGYWLTRLNPRPDSTAMAVFRRRLGRETANGRAGG